MKIRPAELRSGEKPGPVPGESLLPQPEPGAGSQAVFRLKKILVPVDFSDCTAQGLAYAMAFAQQFGAELTLVHVVEPSLMPPAELTLLPEAEVVAEAERDLGELSRQIPEGIRHQTLVRQGKVEKEIAAVARELGIDLILLSTHGRRGLGRVVMGSTAEKVVRHAGCPVLVVRRHEHDFLAPG